MVSGLILLRSALSPSPFFRRHQLDAQRDQLVLPWNHHHRAGAGTADHTPHPNVRETSDRHDVA
jgi:hypothetical protein